MDSTRTRVFVVDDHPLVREWLSALLREQPDLEICGQADHARNALAPILAARPDVAIVDLFLKGGSGLDLIKELREQAPQTDVIVLSMHEEPGYAERALRAGARGYVTKRESTTQIVEAIRQVRKGRVFANGELLAALAGRMVGQATAPSADPVEDLSDRELEVFRRLGQGRGTREIASELGLSLPTVQTYCQRIKEKLRLESAHELVREAVSWVQDQENP
jgi:DNA-binding NarL/FixJ family response regulator